MAGFLRSNATCAVCRERQAKKLCKCKNEPLCGDGACLASHMSKGNIHVLADYEVAVNLSSEETQSCFQAFNKALEVSQFIEKEVKWLNLRKAEIVQTIEEHVNSICEDARYLGALKREETEELVDRLTGKLLALRQSPDPEQLLQARERNEHILSITCTFSQPEIHSSIVISSTAESQKYELGTAIKSKWGCSGKVDAIAIKPSKEVTLKALEIGKQSDEFHPTNIESLEIRVGLSTRGKVIYSHDERTSLASDLPATAIVKLHDPVTLKANTSYTIRAVLSVGTVYCITQIAENKVQNGLEIAYETPSFEGGDADNGSKAGRGIFFAMHY